MKSKTVLSFGCTPGDIEMGCGGTEALLADQGYEITHFYLRYNGEAEENSHQETKAAAQCIGVANVIFLDVGCGAETCNRVTIEAIAKIIRAQKPELVFTFSGLDPRPEHHALSCAIKAGAEAASQNRLELEGEPWEVPAVFGFEIKPPLPAFAHAVNISLSIDRKINAIDCYQNLNQIACSEAMRALSRYRGLTTRKGEYAEVFELLFGNFES